LISRTPIAGCGETQAAIKADARSLHFTVISLVNALAPERRAALFPRDADPRDTSPHPGRADLIEDRTV